MKMFFYIKQMVRFLDFLCPGTHPGRRGSQKLAATLSRKAKWEYPTHQKKGGKMIIKKLKTILEQSNYICNTIKWFKALEKGHRKCEVRRCQIPEVEAGICAPLFCSLCCHMKYAKKRIVWKTLQGYCWNLFIKLPLQWFLSSAFISSYFPRSTEYKILSCIPRQHKICQKVVIGWSWIQLDSEDTTTGVPEVIRGQVSAEILAADT